MQNLSISRPINGSVYVFTKIPPTRAFRLMTKMLSLVAEPLGLGVKDIKDLKSIKNLDINVSEAVQALILNLDTEEAHTLLTELVGEVYVDNRPLKGRIDEHFLQKGLTDMVEVFTEQVRFQYEDFLKGVGGILARAFKASSSTPSPTPPMSAGGSGESSKPGLRLSRRSKPTGA